MIDKIVQAPIDDLIPYVNNAKKHSAEQITKIAASIMEFGFITPVIVDEDNGVLAGHGRILAAKEIGMDKIPCLYVNHLSEPQKRAFILADNRLSEQNGGWDKELLSLELRSLMDDKFDIELTGFEASKIELDPVDVDISEPEPKLVNCPHCKRDFDSRGREV